MKQLMLGLVLVAPLLVGAAGAVADDDPESRILVTGQGSAELKPDMAVLNLTVTREAKTARAALDANSAAMAKVLAELQAVGIEERDLQTSNFNIQPRYTQSPRKADGERPPPRIAGYVVRNSLSVRVRDIDLVGGVLDKSVELGVNEGGNIQFGNDDPSAAITKARKAAVADALDKARTLAAAAGVELGDILEISEQSRMPRPVPMMDAEMGMMRAASAPVPVAAGENSYSVTVNMSVEIEQ